MAHVEHVGRLTRGFTLAAHCQRRLQQLRYVHLGSARYLRYPLRVTHGVTEETREALRASLRVRSYSEEICLRSERLSAALPCHARSSATLPYSFRQTQPVEQRGAPCAEITVAAGLLGLLADLPGRRLSNFCLNAQIRDCMSPLFFRALS